MIVSWEEAGGVSSDRLDEKEIWKKPLFPQKNRKVQKIAYNYNIEYIEKTLTPN